MATGVYLELNGTAGTLKCGHSKSEHRYLTERAAPYKGCMVLFDKPHKPRDRKWRCGTDVIWPCIDKTFLAELGRKKGDHNIFVCRHMINAGD